MLNGIENALNRISNFMLFGFKARMNNKEFLEQEIMRWKGSPERIPCRNLVYKDMNYAAEVLRNA